MYLRAAYLCCVVDLRVKINLYFLVQILFAIKIGMSGENGAPLQMQIGFLRRVAHVEPSKCIYRSLNLDFMDKRVRLIIKSVPNEKLDGFHFQNWIWANLERISWCIWILHEARHSTSYIYIWMGAGGEMLSCSLHWATEQVDRRRSWCSLERDGFSRGILGFSFGSV